MATRASPKAAGRKKVRCPKCTALFTEPTKAVFKCPICECRLSANGGSVLLERPLEEGGSGYRPDGLSKDQPNKMQSPMDLVRKEGNGMTQEGKLTDFEQDSAVYHGHGYKKGDHQPNREESSQSLNNGDTDEQPPVESSTINGTHGRNNMLSPTHPVSKPGNFVEEKERGDSPPLPHFSVGANKEAAFSSKTGQHPLDDGSQENSSMVKQESTEEGLEREDCVVNGGVSSKRHLQAQMFRTTRGEFSFKYSLVGASPLRSDSKFQRKRSPPATTTVLSEAPMPNVNASDMPLHTPLRVRISKAHEESSDPSEHGRESFGSETDSDDTSGSDFDFPAPWAEGPQDLVLPPPFKGNGAFHPNLATVLSGAPHQLELQDVDESEEIIESGKHPEEVHDTELFSQVKNAGKSKESEQAHPGEFSQHDKKDNVLPDRSELTIEGLKPITTHNQSIDVSNLAGYISSAMHLSANENDEVLVARDRMQKLNGLTGGEVQEVGFKGNSLQDKLRNAEPFMNVSQPEAAREPLGVPPNSEQVLKIKRHGNGTQDSIDAGFANAASTAHFWPKQSAPHLNYTDFSDEVHTVPNTESFQTVRMSEKGSHPMLEGLLSSMHKAEHSNDVAHVRDGRAPKHKEMETHRVDTEIEQDLYKLPLPHESYKKDLYLPESSRPALWVEAEEASASAFSDDSTSKTKLYHERKSTQRSVHSKKMHGNVASRVIRSNSGEGQLIMSSEVRNGVRVPGTGVGMSVSASQASLHASSENAKWEDGHMNAAEGRSNHADMYGKPGPYSQLEGFLAANSHPYVFASHPHGFAASGSTSQMYSYQLPAQPLMLPAAAFQNHALSHCGYRPVSSACMLCSYHQHPHLTPQHIPHFGACCSPNSSIGYSPGGLVEHWNCHQANFGSVSSGTGSLVDSPQAYSSSAKKEIQSYDLPIAESRSQASSAKKYPPYPKIGAAPYVACKGCARVLEVPSTLPLNDGSMPKLRCGSCGKVTKFSASVPNAFSSGPNSMGGATNMLPQRGAYSRHNKQLPISSATEIIKSSYKHDMIKGNPILHRSNEVSPITRSPEQNPQGEEFRRVQPRGQAMDASPDAYGQHDPSISVSITGPAYLQNTSGVAGSMSPRNTAMRAANSFEFERSKESPAASYHLPVDEKEEGLDYGAPRISDGDSLDQSESRMRSPEYNQAGRERQHVDVVQGAALRGQVSDTSEEDGTAGLEKPGSPLHVLFNQESTRFRLNLEPRVPFEGAKSTLWSPVSDSAVYASSLPADHFQRREQDNNLRSHGSPGHHFVSKGPKYIAGLLRRSLRDFSRGGGGQ